MPAPSLNSVVSRLSTPLKKSPNNIQVSAQLMDECAQAEFGT
jgi:hypothetical protein